MEAFDLLDVDMAKLQGMGLLISPDAMLQDLRRFTHGGVANANGSMSSRTEHWILSSSQREVAHGSRILGFPSGRLVPTAGELRSSNASERRLVQLRGDESGWPRSHGPWLPNPLQMSPFRVACLLSHRRALQYFLEAGFEHAVVLEADAVESPRWHTSGHRASDADDEPKGAAAAVLGLARSVAEYDPNWSLINLGRCFDDCRSEEELEGVSGFVQSPLPLCTHAYVVSRAGARALLEYSLPAVMPVDHLIALLGRSPEVPFSVYSAKTALFMQDGKDKPECDDNAPSFLTPSFDSQVLKWVTQAQVNSWVAGDADG